MTTTIIGTGLIGGSMALAFKEKDIASRIIGVDANPIHQKRALELGLVDAIMNMEEAITASQMVVLAIPVTQLMETLPAVLDKTTNQVIMDVGSTKQSILSIIKNHPQRSRFVATHPMWGTEYSGPDAAEKNAFANKACVICNKEESDKDAVKLIEKIYGQLGMHIMYMNAAEHDVHVAYISHISHITSFALANTVLEKEREENAIFELASGGFESTVRLAKSNPATWSSVFKENRENVLDVLNEHISQLLKFKAGLEKENYEYLEELMTNANKIKRILR